jgi:DMSO/TMAO reductase YedYZ molybdopterin-dependent catalytic subunit
MKTGRLAVLSGIVSALAVLAVAEVVAVFIAAQASPVFAVGQLMIDLAPSWLKDLMISLFGTGDKAALFVILGLVVLAAAAAAGLIELRLRHAGLIVIALLAVVSGIAVLTRPDVNAAWILPTAVGTIAGMIVLDRSVSRLQGWRTAVNNAPASASVAAVSRRAFFSFVGATAVIGAAAVVGARLVNAGTTAVTAVRQAIRLPKPVVAAAPIPAGADLNIPGVAPLITPNDDFYRIDIALQVPQIDPESWSLQVTGMVEKEITLTYADLLKLPMVEHITTIACVSNDVGGDLIGNAVWLGYPLRDLLQQAGVKPGADMVLSSGPDGFTAGTPLEILQDPAVEALLAVGMNAEPLSPVHGFPARMIVPGLYGYVSATKWVTRMEVTRFADAEGYWTPRGWSVLGPVKTQSRIDTPKDRSAVAEGKVPIAGAAWAQTIGVAGVEVRIDQGEWQQAELATAISDDTWVQWKLLWDATPGTHRVEVRATDASGYTQTSQRAPVVPDGATGYDFVEVNVQG